METCSDHQRLLWKSVELPFDLKATLAKLFKATRWCEPSTVKSMDLVLKAQTIDDGLGDQHPIERITMKARYF